MYGTVDAMVSRFGLAQIVRLSKPGDRNATEPDAAKVLSALSDASSIIDGFLRGRYVVPLATPLPEIIRAACILARYDLAQSEGVDPSSEMAVTRKEIMDWLKLVSSGDVLLAAESAASLQPSYNDFGGRHSDREAVMSYDTLRGI